VSKRLRRQRESGALRQLPSGRWQPQLLASDGRYVSLGTYRTRTAAVRVLEAATVDQRRGAWVDPRRGRMTFAVYATRWLQDRPGIRPRTQELYEGQLRLHLLPTFADTPLADVSPLMVRQWHAQLLRAGRPGPVTVAKCYRLLRSIFATAVADELIVKNPCVIKNAGVEHTAERPVATIAQVDHLVLIAPPRLKALVLTATYTSLRFGELSALTRRHVDLDAGLITVVASAAELRDGTRIVGAPKSVAGRRRVAVPEVIADVLADHIDTFSEGGPDGLVFVGPKGGPLRRGNFHTAWRSIVRDAELDGLRFHDLRHTGNTLAAMTGASTKELMSRMGHSSPRAALIYQHATAERELEIAAKLTQMVVASRA
jgi:integrase